jgi:hypothetical protein
VDLFSAPVPLAYPALLCMPIANFDKRAGDRLKHSLVARLNHLGYTVTLQEQEAA